MNASTERALVFQCAGEGMVAVLHEPAGGAAACTLGVLVIVGGPQYRVGSHRQFVHMARALAGADYPVMRFDYRGMGDSGGPARDFMQISTDVQAAISAFMAAIPLMRGIVVWGLCDAASAALLHATADVRVVGLILANPWVRTASGEAKAYLQHYYGRRFLQLSFWTKLLSGKLNVLKSIVDFAAAFRLARSGAEPAAADAAGHDFILRMLRGLRQFTGPVLILISERDLTASEFTSLISDDAHWRATLARPAVAMETLAGADHTFSSRPALDAATGHCITWLEELRRCR